MKTEMKSIKDVLTDYLIMEIPYYQREYVWKEEQWERFLEYIEYVSETNKPYFLGSLILKKKGNICTVIDGQQRLTTWCIFAKVYSLKAKEKLNRKYFYLGKRPRIQHSEQDYKVFNRIIGLSKEEDIGDSHSGLVGLYNFFRERMDKAWVKKIDFAALEKNLEFATLNLEQYEDEQQIFETVNSDGVRLTVSEMLKNYLFNQSNRRSYEENWVQVFDYDDETRRYWKQVISSGSRKRTTMDLFFESYLQVLVQEGKYRVSEKNKKAYSRIDHMFKSYQYFIKDYVKDKEKLIKGIKEYTQCFRETFNPDWIKTPWEKSNPLKRLNVIIFGLDTTTIVPYVLYLRKNIDDTQKFYGMCEILESYLMRRMVARGNTKNYNRFFTKLIHNNILDVVSLKDMIRNEKEGKGNTTSLPNDEELLKGFLETKMNNKQAKGVLFLIESGLRAKDSFDPLSSFQTYSLEHLMPQKWEDEWGTIKDEKKKRERNRIVYTMGNLAIIPQGLNSSISNSNWTKKLKGTSRHKGLKECGRSSLTLEKALKQPEWNEKTIKSRAKQLYKQAKKVWKKI